ncbi:glutaminase A [Amniculicola lignicola CBS 123094]|uniref:Glutaminase A n=1 Tax=Amniculicola lignicola CBS 123094 TaxID=1392246 RepID=A0A6A5WKY1_9PLEO|nr:glutaminase A [Amniculicola lignicola CBS 123094]
MRPLASVAIAAAALLAGVTEASSLRPPVLPLIVRNPYLSTWLGNARDEPWKKWPMFWTGGEVGFGVLASLPDSKEVFPLLGRPHDSLKDDQKDYSISYPTYKGAKYDASTTNLTYSLPAPDKLKGADDLEITLSFLSPITPTSTLRQSIPAAYLTVYVEGSFDVNIYIDVNGQWVSGKRDSVIEWGLTEQEAAGSVKALKTWKVKRQTEQLLTEERDQAEWGQLHFTGPDTVRHESGTSALLRQRFARTGTLQNADDGQFRQIMDEEPVFAFAKEFKLEKKSSTTSSKSTSDSVLFTITHIQDPVTQYASARGLTFMRPLWKSWFLADDSLVQFHYGDFENANVLAGNYSEQLRIDAYTSGSSNYVDIVALSARQAMGATSFSGTPDNPLLFLKEISSNGNTQTVDVIFPAFPFFLYTNPRWAAYILEPLLEHQLSGQYPNNYSMHDLGSHFPNLTGHADGRDEYMPVEECGDMLIMGLALINSMTYNTDAESQSIWSTVGDRSDYTTQDEKPFTLKNLGMHEGIQYIDDTWGGGAKGVNQAKQWLEKSYDLWKKWTGYLVEYSLEPHNQLCTDDFAGWLALQTNLALKGIIGIKAMSEMSDLLDRTGDAKDFRNISDTYIEKWQELGISRDGSHAKLAYDWYGSWTTLYSLYADAVLCFHPSITNASTTPNLAHTNPQQQPLTPSKSHSRTPITKDFIPSHIYKIQSNWYSAVMQKYGLPLDSRHLYTKSDWEFEAAAVASKKVRSEILDRVAMWLNETSTDRPFTDLYETEGSGGFPGPWFFARPVVGGHFAFLTLERACGGTGAKGLGRA